MAYYLKHWGVVQSPYDGRDSGLSGSSRFRSYDPLFDDKLMQRVARSNRVAKIGYVEDTADKDHDKVVTEAGPRMYGVNVAKLRAKAIAFALLQASQRFLAFYTVSFPAGLSDDCAYKIWNSCLTFCRAECRLRSYLWVAEYQKNGTIHYHMLTNDYMDVVKINRFVAGSIDYHVQRGAAVWGRSSLERYNGVDVKPVFKRGARPELRTSTVIVERVVRYLSKYVSKDLRCSAHRVWHCSRLVSALFVSCSLGAGDLLEVGAEMGKDVRMAKSGDFTFYFFVAIRLPFFTGTLCRINEMVWGYFEENDCW